MSLALQATFWGLVSGAALVIGAALAYVGTIPQRVVAAVMAFGSGVLISALAFELVDEAYEAAGFTPVALGFLIGAVVYTFANIYLNRRGARRRKRSGRQPQGDAAGAAIALGALLDGIPESVVIGASLVSGPVSMPAVVAVFLSNLPEGLSSAAGMRKAGRSPLYVFGVWGGIALASGLAALAGNVLLAGTSPFVVAFVTAFAAGGILAMLCDTMIPEAFEHTREFAGLIAVLGFLTAFALSKFA